MKVKNILIAGAAGRDYHNFLVYFRNNPNYKVVCFTAAQIPDIEKRKFPKELTDKLYKKDIPIFPELKLAELIKKYKIDEVVLSYSDLSHEEVMHKASIVLAAGASFRLLGPNDTMLKSNKPIISICAVRTGAGKSQTSRKVADILRYLNIKVVACRHPMPYGFLEKQIVQRFSNYKDLDKYETTIEEREEYEPWIKRKIPIYAGVDYEKILRQAEKEADIIIWDGGNNDFPFFKSDLQIVVVDPHRAGHELSYYPGETNFRMADVIIINKIDSAPKQNIKIIEDNIKKINPKAIVIKARSKIIVDNPKFIKGKRVLLVEDGPTITHGGMKFGAATVAAKLYKAKEIINAKKYAVGSIKETYEKYKHLEKELPAMGYSKQQIKDLQETINKADCDIILDGSPVNLSRLIKINKPIVNVNYELEEVSKPNLNDVIKNFVKRIKIKR